MPANFSVLLTFSTMTDLMSLLSNSSMLIFKTLDNNFNCSGLGEVSPNSQLEMVCQVTSTFSASCS